uniref:NADH:ubiquinone reductase (H(+)-translocating) n=1 Tax=Lyperosomum longicauda TaxID=2714089 RepID=A0A6H0YC11_9TREM|nr:NADH dehydrogenase subunit 5 [Lyperosomum longicauda]QIX04660.1 NADH dehydrogenase subunit 5 [Lyperosomum longicauda]
MSLGMVLWFVVGWLVFSSLDFTSISLSFSLLGTTGVDGVVSFVWDSTGLLCLYMLFSCSLMSLKYCCHYFSGGDAVSLVCLMSAFVFVMTALVLSGSALLTLVCWEYLGLVSFFLILFYGTGVSLRSAFITAVSSRFGDVGLFVFVVWLINCFSLGSFVFVVIMLSVFLTKSACYPFSSWLIEAMRAPTPVSSLVHSSTLVVAGVWFLLRYRWVFVPDVMDWVFVFCVVTIFMSGCCALFVTDLKKLVALSTCNNVSWCLVFFAMGGVDLALFQLMTHGLAKCYLFMTVGDLMSLSCGTQNSSVVYCSRYWGCNVSLVLSVLVFSLCGLPFLGAFFGKHSIFIMAFYGSDVLSVVLLLLAAVLSYAYSFRMVLLLLVGETGVAFGYGKVFVGYGVVCFLVSYIGSLACAATPEVTLLSPVESLFMLFLELMGFGLGYWLFTLDDGVSGFLMWVSSLCDSDAFVDYVYRSFMWLGCVVCACMYRWEVDVFFNWVLRLYSVKFYSVFFVFNLVVLGVIYFGFVFSVL